jgi:hypothetical protein
MTTRRSFLKAAAAGVGAVVLDGIDSIAQAAPATPLIDNVAAACRRLAPLGWRQMLLDATNGELDITASDLRGALATPLTHIDRGFPGFGDFASTGTRAIQPGQPDRSLLHHAFASPTVVADRTGGELRGFPTLAEIEAVENYTYGVEPPTLAELRGRAGNRPLAIAVFALHYRNAPDSVHGHHAELCFARTGISRLGTLEPQYDARLRMFVNVDDSRPFDFRVVPRRFAAFLAVQLAGNSAGFGPQDPLDGDDKLQFWVPLHKLFSGPECIAGLDLDVTYSRGLHNEELAEFHRFLDRTGLQNNWRGEMLEHFPFTSRNEMIGSLSTRAAYGSGVLEPRPSPLVMPAQYEGRPLTFPVDGKYTPPPGRPISMMPDRTPSDRRRSTSTSATVCCRMARSTISTAVRTCWRSSSAAVTRPSTTSTSPVTAGWRHTVRSWNPWWRIACQPIARCRCRTSSRRSPSAS